MKKNYFLFIFLVLFYFIFIEQVCATPNSGSEIVSWASAMIGQFKGYARKIIIGG